MSTAFPGSRRASCGNRSSPCSTEAGETGLEPEDIAEQIGRTCRLGEIEDALRAPRGPRAGPSRSRGAGTPRRSTPWVVGVVEVLENGRRPDPAAARARRPELFIRQRNLKGAMTATLVLVRRLGRRAKAGDWKLPEGAVLKILSDADETLVGTLEPDEEGRRWLVPYDPKCRSSCRSMGGGRRPGGSLRGGPRGARAGGRAGAVIEVLGDPEHPGVDVLVVLRHYQHPGRVPAGRRCSRPGAVPARSHARRTGGPRGPPRAAWSSPSTARAPATSTTRSRSSACPNGHLPPRASTSRTWPTTSQEGSALDLEAYRRGTSVYYPDRADPHAARGALQRPLLAAPQRAAADHSRSSWTSTATARSSDRRFAETVIQSARRMTYNEVRRILEEPQERDRGGVRPGPALPARDARADDHPPPRADEARLDRLRPARGQRRAGHRRRRWSG